MSKENKIEEYNKQFLLRHEDQINKIKENNPKQKLPIFKNKEGMYIWLNRANRRKKNVRL